MARTLSERDLAILSLLAPEVTDPLCPGSGHGFFSILPPVSNHFATDDADFLNRIEQLPDEDLTYLAIHSQICIALAVAGFCICKNRMTDYFAVNNFIFSSWQGADCLS